MSQTRRRRVALLIYGTVLMCLTGCATGRRAHERDLQQLAATLPGIYETLPQPEQPALQLAITPLLVPVIGEHVFHVRESIAGDGRRIVSQSIWMLTLDAQGNIAQTVWRFSQPERWRTGDKELFRSLLPQDLQPLPGCMLQWTRTAPGYNARNVATPVAAAEGSNNPIPAQLQLNGDRLSASVQRCGEAATPATVEVWYQFQRRRS
jgi:CpeT/CpcT family (DUF1001)